MAKENETMEQLEEETPTAGAGLRPYDFRRPSQISRDDLRQLVAYCEQFGRRASVSLSSDLSALATVAPPDSLRQCTYEEFSMELENPAHVIVLSLRPVGVSMILYLPARVALCLVERKMGGPGAPEQPKRSLTDIEVGVVSEIVGMLTRDFSSAISPLIQITASTTRTESNPQLVQAVPATDVVTVLRFGLKIGPLTDEFTLCIPAAFWQEAFKGRPTEDSPQLSEHQRRARLTLERRILDTPADVRLRFPAVFVGVADVAGLTVGDELPLNAQEGDELVVDVGGIPTYTARWVREGRRDACQITTIHPSNPERLSRPETPEV